MSKKIKFRIVKKHIPKPNWLVDNFKDRKFNIIETVKQGDCFFDSIRLALPPNLTKSVRELREMLIPYITDTVFNLHRTIYSNGKTDHDREIMREFRFFDDRKINTIDKYKAFVLHNNFWANSWAISIIETELHIKIVILSEYAHTNGRNILVCGDFEIDPLNSGGPKCKICGMTFDDKEYLDETLVNSKTTNIYRNVLLNHGHSIDSLNGNAIESLKRKYNTINRSDHKFEDPVESTKEYKPKGFIVVTYNGNHYRLVSYNGTSFFKSVNELPSKLVGMMKRQCSNAGLYKRIKELQQTPLKSKPTPEQYCPKIIIKKSCVKLNQCGFVNGKCTKKVKTGKTIIVRVKEPNKSNNKDSCKTKNIRLNALNISIINNLKKTANLKNKPKNVIVLRK